METQRFGKLSNSIEIFLILGEHVNNRYTLIAFILFFSLTAVAKPMRWEEFDHERLLNSMRMDMYSRGLSCEVDELQEVYDQKSSTKKQFKSVYNTSGEVNGYTFQSLSGRGKRMNKMKSLYRWRYAYAMLLPIVLFEYLEDCYTVPK